MMDREREKDKIMDPRRARGFRHSQELKVQILDFPEGIWRRFKIFFEELTSSQINEQNICESTFYPSGV